MAVQTTGDHAALLHSYYVKKLLQTLQPRLQLYKLGKKTQLPQGLGVRAKWLIYTKIASSTTALTEGTNPSEISFTTANVTADVAQYGQFAKVSDLLESTAIDNTIENLAELFGKAGAETIEDLIVAQLDSALTVQRVNSRAANNDILASDVVTLKEFLRGSITLKQAYVKPHEMGAYMAVLHNATEYDMLSEVNPGGWLDLASYAKSGGPGSKEVMEGEIGKCYGIRFVVSDKMTAAANSGSISVKNNYLIGEECFGVVELGQKSVEMIIKPSDSGGQSNPLNMFGTVGYKIKGFAAKNFAANRGLVIKGASSFSAA
jgi:N4-gp56 family major capsid protein